MQRAPKIERVLIYKVGSLGDTVAALPCFHLIARLFPDAERKLLTNLPLQAKVAAAETVLEGSGLIHGTIRYAMKRGGIWRKWWEIVRFRPDLVVHLRELRPVEGIRRDQFFFRYACGAKWLVGFPAVREERLPLNDGSRYYESEAARQARMIGELGDAQLDDPASWDLCLTQAEWKQSSEALGSMDGREFIACAPASAMQAKDWGRERWQELLARLSDDLPGRGLVLIGAAQDHETAEFVRAHWQGPVLNLCGKTPVRVTAGVLAKASLFLGCDSGPMHLAAAMATPCVIAFASREHRGIWFPYGKIHRVLYREVECSNCLLKVCIENQKKCLTAITVNDMREAALEAMANQKNAFPYALNVLN